MYPTLAMSEGMQRSSRPMTDRPPPMSDRYEALPSVGQLPGWIWRRLPRAAKLGVALLPVAVVALVLLLGPGIDESKDERARNQARSLEQARAERVAALRAEQRPRFGRGTPAGPTLAARAALLDAASGAVARDARARVAAGKLDGPIRGVTCEPYPRTVEQSGAHRDPERRFGTYACLAVTSQVAASEINDPSSIGHPYRLRIDFESGRYAFCKVSGRAGEGSIGRQPLVPVPPACSGA
jgi:hypothetical protein